MKTIIRHHWIKQNGFRIDKCSYCGTIRKWDGEKIVYLESGLWLKLIRPSCKRLFFSDQIIKLK
jgi:hypothetical protein